ncbi:hypothetical protein TNIN_237431 [Trichonephila inaurata madagascariensis]|uniref:Uncharacterized protein n=1 Tax=Trichonephila inaurata madagascariensis TaxID=2747483 RepID=A0A8X6IAY3_9ARAC|nr:hypothetical protein TNIN_237431 [Trichonephila inaurata madagascariensis]
MSGIPNPYGRVCMFGLPTTVHRINGVISAKGLPGYQYAECHARKGISGVVGILPTVRRGFAVTSFPGRTWTPSRYPPPFTTPTNGRLSLRFRQRSAGSVL